MQGVEAVAVAPEAATTEAVASVAIALAAFGPSSPAWMARTLKVGCNASDGGQRGFGPESAAH